MRQEIAQTAIQADGQFVDSTAEFRESRTINSAAALGVGARRSATKSAMVKSISCPTALTTGIGE